MQKFFNFPDYTMQDVFNKWGYTNDRLRNLNNNEREQLRIKIYNEIMDWSKLSENDKELLDPENLYGCCRTTLPYYNKWGIDFGVIMLAIEIGNEKLVVIPYDYYIYDMLPRLIPDKQVQLEINNQVYITRAGNIKPYFNPLCGLHIDLLDTSTYTVKNGILTIEYVKNGEIRKLVEIS